MRFFNIKTKSYYDSPRLLVVGPVEKSVKTITDYGFFESTIHRIDSRKIPSGKPFVVSESIPDDWDGETVGAPEFVTLMNSRRVSIHAAVTGRSYTNSGLTASYDCGGCNGHNIDGQESDQKRGASDAG